MSMTVTIILLLSELQICQAPYDCTSECLTTGLLHLILGVIHTNVSCHECKKQSIEGIRWECSDCVSFNLCSSCYMNDKHPLDHGFNRIEARGKPG